MRMIRMIRDEITNEIKNILSELNNGEDAVSYLTQNDVEWLNENIKALEQESCDDCISRETLTHDLQKLIESWKKHPVMAEEIKGVEAVLGYVKMIPPVQPKPKSGHWIEGKTDNPNIHNILCSCCFEGYPSKGHANSQYTKEKFQWCPKCGAKMINVPDINDGKCSEIPKGSESEG